MFGLFKKKEKAETPKPQPAEDKSAAFKAFTAGFLPDTLDILAVTGPAAFGGKKQADSDLWEASIFLTAWMEEDSPEIHREPTPLVILAAADLLNVLRQRLPANFILKLKARPSEDGTRLLLVDLPSPGFDPDLKAILEEQKKPVTFDAEDIGTFTLSRSMGWFQTEADWMGQTIQLTFDLDSDREDSLTSIRALLADPAGWDGRLRACAADQLLDRANETLEEDGEDTLDREEFMETIQLESIQVGEGGSFTAVFSDNGLFWGNPILVTGTVTGGPDAAKTGDEVTEAP